ncbi:gp53-like domain-containing protein [Enterobacter sichuanensis]
MTAINSPPLCRGGRIFTDFAMCNCFSKNLRLGEAAKRGVGTAANQIPDMSFFSGSLSVNGYINLPNGLILQWGGAGGLSQYSINFNIPFPNTCLQAYAVTDGDKDGVDVNLRASVEVGEFTSNGFTATCWNAAGSSSPAQKLASRAIHWFALGR